MESAAALFEVVENGMVEIKINQRYPLEDAAKAHADLEARQDHRHHHPACRWAFS